MKERFNSCTSFVFVVRWGYLLRARVWDETPGMENNMGLWAEIESLKQSVHNMPLGERTQVWTGITRPAQYGKDDTIELTYLFIADDIRDRLFSSSSRVLRHLSQPLWLW